MAYLCFCVRTFCVNISTGHAARPAHGDPICCVCTFCVGVPRGYPAYLINGDRIAKVSQDIRPNSQIEEFSGVGV